MDPISLFTGIALGAGLTLTGIWGFFTLAFYAMSHERDWEAPADAKTSADIAGQI